jgi:hypothetical protein
VFEAREMAALTGTNANAPEKAFELGTIAAFPDVVRAEATSVWVARSSTISKIKYCELKTFGNMADTSSTFDIFLMGVDRYRVYEFEF